MRGKASKLNRLGKRRGIGALGLFFAAGLATHAMGATAVWDGGANPTFDWSNAANWNPDGAPVANDSLLFTGSVGLTSNNDFTAGTQFNGITFDAGGPFTLTGNALNLGGDVTANSAFIHSINLNLALLQNTTFNTVFNNGTNASTITVNSVISGTGFGLTKTGSGQLNLTRTNTYTGNTSITGGTLNLAFNDAGAPNSNIIDPISNLVMGGFNTGGAAATLTATSKSTPSATQTFASTTFTMGRSAVIVSGGTSPNTMTVALGGITRQAGSVVAFTLNTRGIVTTSTGNTGTTGILGGWATAGTSWATRNVSNQIVAYTGYTALGGNNPALASNADSNVNLNAPTSVTVTGALLTLGSTTISGIADTSGLTVGEAVQGAGAITNGNMTNTLAIAPGSYIVSIDGPNQITVSLPVYRSAGGSPTGTQATNVTVSSAHNVSLAAGTTEINTFQVTDTNNHVVDVAGKTLRLGAYGAIWHSDSNAAGGVTFRGGTITAGGAANSAGEIVLNTNAGGTTGNSATTLQRTFYGVIIESVIADNGSGVVSLIKNGNGSILLSGANTFTGNLYVNSGRLESTVAGNLGSGDVYVLGGPTSSTVNGNLQLGGAGTYTNDFYIAGTGGSLTNVTTGAIVTGNGATVDGTITLLDRARIAGVSGSTSTIAAQLIGSSQLDVAGYNGVLTLTNTNTSLFSGDVNIEGAGSNATVAIGPGGVLPNGANKGNLIITQTGSGNAILDLRGNNETINAIISAGTAADIRRIVQSTGGSPTLTMGDNNASGYYLGRFSNGTGVLSLVKTGSGTQTIAGSGSGLSTYTGTTTFQGGTVSVSIVANGAVASSIGQATTLASNLVFDGGALQYTGANGSSNRWFTINPGKTAILDVTANTLTLTGSVPTTSGGLQKIGAGVLTLTGNLLHGGPTTVGAGTMNLAAPLSSNNLSASSTLMVNSGATLNVTGLTLGTISLTSGQTLGGNGTVVGNVNAGATGNIAPGASLGTLTTGSLTLANDSTLTIEADLDSTPVNGVFASDVLAVNGSVTLGGDLVLVLSGTELHDKTILLINNDDDADAGIAVATSFGSVSGLGGMNYTIHYGFDATTGAFTGGNDVAISTPEPASLSVLMLAAGGLLRRRRRVSHAG